MRVYVWLLLIGCINCLGCTSIKIDSVLLDTQLQNGQKAISHAAELNAEQLATDEYSRSVKLLKFAKQAQERGEIAQSMEFAYQAELVAQIALYKARQQLARSQFLTIREKMYQEIITEKDYEIEKEKILNEIKSLENAQALKEIKTQQQRSGSLTTDLNETKDILRSTQISIPISGAQIIVTIAQQTFPEIVETAEYERVQSAIASATSHLERKEFDEGDKTATDALAQAHKLYELAAQSQKSRDTEKTNALIAIERAQVKIQRAGLLNATTHDPEQYQQSQIQLKNAQNAFEQNRYGEAKQAAQNADQTVVKVIATAEVAEFRRRAQEEQSAKIIAAQNAVETVRTMLAEQEQTNIQQVAPELYEQSTKALATAEAALEKNEYDAAIEASQQSKDYLQRAIEMATQQNTEQTNLVEAVKQIPRAVVIETQNGVLVRISGDLFAITSTSLKQTYFPTFMKLASILLQDKFKEYSVKIEGHSDSLGDANANQSLTERRANTIKKFLIQKGKVSAQQLTAVGLGESKPIDNTAQERNRRIDIYINRTD